MEDRLYALDYKHFNPVSFDTDDVAYEYGIKKEKQDKKALRSHQNYGAASNSKRGKQDERQ